MGVSVHTTWGEIRLDTVAGEVVRCRLPDIDQTPTTPFRIKELLGDGDDGGTSGLTENSARFMTKLFNGQPASPPSYRFPEGSAFYQKVWRALQDVPSGKTRTYGDIARQIGHPRAARAVGQACATNPLPLIIPCHRVLAAGNRPGGFTGGRAWKELLLDAEARG